MGDSSFSLDSDVFPLTSGDLHLWHGALDDPRFAALPSLLSRDEQVRAARYLDPLVGRRFAVGRGLLRLTLGHYLKLPPNSLIFEGGGQSKPRLNDPLGASNLEFNLSHSNGMILIGVAQGRQVGVDLEYIRPIDQPLKLAKRFFSPAEAAKLARIPESDQQVGFFRCWTYKEAYIKARGGGMSIPLDSFEVAFSPDETPCLLYCTDDNPQRWQLIAITTIPGYASAVVIERPLNKLTLRAI
ncbi:4'-phosphopantetheinyl transferase [Anaerolineae bacterium]|nr:4'-phosphopantetheinyl transferase [Anaerolineae bacterium]